MIVICCPETFNITLALSYPWNVFAFNGAAQLLVFIPRRVHVLLAIDVPHFDAKTWRRPLKSVGNQECLNKGKFVQIKCKQGHSTCFWHVLEPGPI
jgi:hypothetical protein